jgi:sarcosine oxidase subunit beta
MQNTADAVIIGGGILGASVAFHLAKANYGNIVLVEKEPLMGSGATAKAAGGIRAQFVTKENIQMSMLSEELFKSFKDDTGYDALFDQVGYLFLVKDDKDVDGFKKSYELQKSLGLNIEILKPEEIGKYAPHVSLDGVQFGTFCKDDGLGDPHEFLSGYDHAARKLGVKIELDAEVTDIEINSGEVKTIKTVRGEISTPLIINCTGPYAKEIGKMVGADVKVEPIKRQIVTTGELSFVEPSFPMVVDASSGLYCHKESKGMLLGWADWSVKPSYDISIDPEYTDGILERALDLIPKLEEAEIANEWAGLYETTPDHNEIIGFEPIVKGLFHVVGFSGHGFMHAPAAGLITAEILTDKEPSIDISNYSPTRFNEDSIVKETNII